MPLAAAIGIALLIGVAAGLINGVLIAYFNLQPFIVTLATMGAIRGSISNCAQLSQSIVASALSSDSIEAERKQKLETLRARALKVREVVQLPEYADDWDVYPFNAGYFMCIRVRGVDAEQLRQHLLNEYGIGLISIGSTDLRVAFSCLEIDEIEPLFAAVHQAIGDLRGTGT